jgi:hypothetical protein
VKYLVFVFFLFATLFSFPLAFSDDDPQIEFERNIDVALIQIRTISDVLETDYLVFEYTP